MSDEEEENPSEENEDEDEENEDEEDEDQDEDEEEEEGSGEDDDQDQDQEQEQEQEQENEDENEQEEQQESKQEKKPLPKFRSVEPEQFKFTSLLSQISSLSLNVDKFIGTLPSHGGCNYRSYLPPPRTYTPPPLPVPKLEQSRVVIMKDEDVQVSLQPQIIIQPTKVEKAPLEPTYKISNQSNKFLAQLYEQNKKLKRWQNSSHNVNSHAGISSVGSGFYGSKERFERQNYEKGLFNVEERNKEIDEAISKLRSEED